MVYVSFSSTLVPETPFVPSEILIEVVPVSFVPFLRPILKLWTQIPHPNPTSKSVYPSPNEPNLEGGRGFLPHGPK